MSLSAEVSSDSAISQVAAMMRAVAEIPSRWDDTCTAPDGYGHNCQARGDHLWHFTYDPEEQELIAWQGFDSTGKPVLFRSRTMTR